jgi:hypothetical protein
METIALKNAKPNFKYFFSNILKKSKERSALEIFLCTNGGAS